MCLRYRTLPGVRRFFLRTVHSDERGVELFEFALVLPVLLMLILGIFWIGRAYNIYETITRAAREGARFAVLPSCATCGDTMVDTYTGAGSCLTNPTNVFTNYVSPALTASNLKPGAVQSYCQMAQWVDSDGSGNVYPANSGIGQCGVVISFTYPVTLAIPFTSLNASTLHINTKVQMRMENQSINSSGAATCP